ncbi:MAG: hypothetical protein RLP09_47505 [Sandaracinaceae bacterium]|nr:hypothetical protein [Myxococcales bacterium]
MAEKTSSAKKWIGFGCLGVVVLSCVGMIVLMVVASNAVAGIDGASVACAGQPVPGAPAYVPGGPQRVLAFQHQESGNWSYAGTLFPHEFPDAESAEEATLVACFEPESSAVEIETCNYHGGYVVRRYQFHRPVRVMAASTGQLVREMDITGDAPAACPEQVATGGGGGGVSVRLLGIPVATLGEEDPAPTEQDQVGSAVSARVVGDALRDLVLP